MIRTGTRDSHWQVHMMEATARFFASGVHLRSSTAQYAFRAEAGRIPGQALIEECQQIRLDADRACVSHIGGPAQCSRGTEARVAAIGSFTP
jgi:hypothetical protein